MVTKYPIEMKTYKQLYYLHNRDKLIEYSQQYYKYHKCNGNFDDEEDINDKMKIFLRYYKKANPDKKTLEKEKQKVKIEIGKIKVKFD